MDPTQFMLPMPSMIPPQLLHNLNIPTSTAPVAPPLPMDILSLWANGNYLLYQQQYYTLTNLNLMKVVLLLKHSH